jgi:hypothetical protein
VSLDPVGDLTADPGWSDAVRSAAWILIPGVSMLRYQTRMRPVHTDGLVNIRTLFVSFTLALATIGGVVAVLTNFSKSNFSRGLHKPGAPVVPGFAAALVVISVAALIVSARIGGRLRVTATTTTAELAGYYRTRFFLRVAFSEACALVGFSGFVATGRWWLYLIGAAFAGVGFAMLAPTAGHLRRDQDTIDETWSGLNLIAALRSTPPPPSRSWHRS